MKNLRVNLGENSYDIIIENGLLLKIGDEIKKVFNGEKIFIITDNNVNQHYGDLVKDELTRSGFTVDKLVLPSGEATKSIDTLPIIYDRMLDFKLTRKDLIITLGGGVIGDLGGFAAATFLRGVPFVQCPTSLLAQVDSSVGGKVAVDLERGKNLVGNFYQPKAVLIDPEVLSTLRREFFRDGMGEVIKYGCIRDKELFDRLNEYTTQKELIDNIEYIIYTCCNIKRQVVENDEKDTGERMILNYGHTLGHAIENYYNYATFTHGEAVAVGMSLITKISEDKGLTEKGSTEKLLNMLKKYELPYDAQIDNMEKVIEAITLDKKNLGKSLKLILLLRIGECYIYDGNVNFFDSMLEK